MYREFQNKFFTTSNELVVERANEKEAPSDLLEMFRWLGGSTFEKGLYRTHSFDSSGKWSSIISEYFVDYKDRIFPFGFDWMGRQFCLGVKDNIIFMFDPATGEDFELRQSLLRFHNDDLVGATDDLLSVNLFEKAKPFHGIDSLKYNECLGTKVPMFLGGKDSIQNYELQDMEVYWHITGQIYNKIRDMPDGTVIGDIKIE